MDRTCLYGVLVIAFSVWKVIFKNIKMLGCQKMIEAAANYYFSGEKSAHLSLTIFS